MENTWPAIQKLKISRTPIATKGNMPPSLNKTQFKQHSFKGSFNISPLKKPAVKKHTVNHSNMLYNDNPISLFSNIKRINPITLKSFHPKLKPKTAKVPMKKAAITTRISLGPAGSSVKWKHDKNKTARTGINFRPKQFTSLFHFKRTNNWYWYIPNSKHRASTENKLITLNEFEILNNIHIPLHYQIKWYKYKNMPACIVDNCKSAHIPIIKDKENCNIIWKLYNQKKNKEWIKAWTKHQKFNHFSSTYQLGCKDNMHMNHKYFEKKFPKEYAFAPLTFIWPGDYNCFIKEYMNKKSKWIVKPVNLSRGRGIHILQKDEILKLMNKDNSALISKYISNPDWINNKKYDLRIYVIVTSFSPLKIYLYNNGLVRFATEDYKKGDYDNIYIHLTNYSINKANINFKENQHIPWHEKSNENDSNNNDSDEGEDNFEVYEDDNASKWSLDQYREHFINNGKEEVFKSLWKGIKDIIIKTIITISGKTNNLTPWNRRNNVFELFGFDIMVTSKYKPKWIEVNTNPSLQCTSPLDWAIKTDWIADIFSIVGVVPVNHKKPDQSLKYENIKMDIVMDGNDSDENKDNKENGEYGEYSDKGNIHSSKSILMEFDRNNLSKKNENYGWPHYKEMILRFREENERRKVTDFELIFPRKDTVNDYVDFWVYDGNTDNNIVWWQYIMSSCHCEPGVKGEEK